MFFWLFSLRFAFALLLAVSVIALPLSAQQAVPDQETPIQSKDVKADLVGSGGEYSHRFDFDLPEFRDLAPDLRLVYNSSDTGRGGAENFVAFGWRLAGLSRIERESVGGGVPMFDDGQDIYRLDDMELMACNDSAATNKWTKKYPLRYLTTVSSASCSAGGNMSTRVESYNRIVYDDVANEFRVTRPDGRRYIYRSVGDIAGDPNTSGNDWLVGKKSRWVLVEIADTQKDAAGNFTNVVSIGWAMGPATDGFAERPVSISYAGYQVGLNYVQPAQPVARFATGGTQLGTQRYRLSSVTITDGVQNVRAYNLVTGPSAQTATALLTKIESYGSDYAVTSGVVTAGTKLPDVSFEYSATLLHKSSDGRSSPFSGQTYPTTFVTGMPSAV